MANVYAVKSGNWSDTTVWNTGALPTAADDVYSNNFTVTVDVSPTVLSVRNTSASGIVAGGSFTATNNIILSATNGFSAGTATLITFTLPSPSSCNLFGNIVASNATSGCIANSGSGVININGSIVSGALGNALGTGVLNSSSGTIMFTGNTVGGFTNQNAFGGCVNSGSGLFNIIGNATQGPGNGPAVLNSSSGSMSITGQIIGSPTAGSGTAAVRNTNIGYVEITGSITAGAANAFTVENTSTGSIQITGSVTGSNTNTSQIAVNNSGAGTVTHSGSAVAGSLSPAITGSTAGIVYCTGPFIGTQSGISAITAGRWRWIPSVGSSYMTVPNSTATGYKNLYTADSTDSQSGQPAATNVRSGTIYGPNSELTGTCAVPGAGSVAFGVPVDNTTGTAVLTAETVRSAVGLASANLDTQLAPLSNLDTTVSSRLAATGYTTPPSVGDIAIAVWSAATSALSSLGSIGKLLVDNINASISSRLATTSYQAPLDAAGTRAAIGLAAANLDAQLDALPTATENASSVRTELTPELNNLDEAVSTRSTFNPATDTVANVTLVGTTTNLTNPPDVPTTLEIADAVRVELTPELDRIDTTVSSRSTFNPATDTVAQVALVDVTTDLTNPPVVPTPEQIAAEVRVELTPELDRIDIDVSSRLASVDYEQAPTSEQNAEAVRVELTPELDRVANCATVATTGEQIQDAWARSPSTP